MSVVALSRQIAIACAAGLASILAACGGSSGQSPAPDVAVEGVIRYEVNYQASGTLPGTTATARYLTVRPLDGNTSFGTRPIGEVQLVFAQEQPRTLTTPTYIDAQGRPNYVFEISSSYTAKWPGLQCTGEAARVTVKDVAGLSFSRNAPVCVAYDQTFAAASDYGDRVATLTATGPDGLMRCALARTQPAAYAESTLGCTEGAHGNSWTLRVAEGDRLVSFIELPEGAAGLTATARVFLEGGALAQSAVVRDDQHYSHFENARLRCCRPTPDPSAPLQTVSLVLSAELPVLVPRDVTVPVDVQYRVIDGATGQSRVDFNERIAFRGLLERTLQARKGDQIFVQASSPAADSYVYGQILPGGMDWRNELGWAATSAAGVPAILNVFVPAAN